MRYTNRERAGVILAVSLAIAGLGVGPALAEGSYSADFSDINPGFSSQHWTDHQNDNNSTTIDFVGCSPANGVPVSSLQIELWDQHGLFPDFPVGSAQSTPGCGMVSWYHGASGYTLNDSTFYWQLESINNSYSNRWMDGTANATY